MKPKEALVKDGFLPPEAVKQRGRLSLAGIERCKELAAQGWDIEGYVVQASNSSTAPTVAKVKTDPNSVSDIPDPTHYEEDWTAWVGDKEVGMRTVCNTCHRSLTYDICGSPRVWLDHEHEGMVTFKPVKV